MSINNTGITPITIEDELKQSYLDYAMSVIVGRALPDVRDGLKPVHRRVLFAMHELNNDWNKAYKKSARVVGDVIGKYHPHGDTAVYDTIVRMAQPFSLRYMLVDGQGNFGSVDGDAPAAMRYTEVRMSRLAHDLLIDLDKETVDFSPNYDGTEMIPDVLPTRVPNLLVNGSSGIAVGMATNIPPHNINEVITACLALIENPALTIDELMGFIPGPDFPTAAIINGRAGIVSAYRTGRGRIYVRARATIEDDKSHQRIVVTELPYQVNKARLLEKIAELVKEKKIEGISGLRDESDKDGMRMVIELKRGEMAEVILNNLYAQTQMQTVFGINMVALVNGEPKLFNLKELLEAFIRHRREVVVRRTVFELRKARERAHILEGLSIAQVNIDKMITLIKQAPNPAEAKVALQENLWQVGDVKTMRGEADIDFSLIDHEGMGFQDGALYRLSETQAQAILELRLHRLTGLEKDKLFGEYREILEKIKELSFILSSTDRLLEVISDELKAVLAQYGDERRTEIIESQADLTAADLITEEDLVVTVSREGYVKAQSLTAYQAQRRGGRGKSATNVKDEDVIERLVIANSHDTILCFSSIGKVYWLKTYQLPQGSRNSRGKPIVNILPLTENERITSILPIKEFDQGKFVFMACASGMVKKVSLEAFSRPRSNGIIAVELPGDDQLIGVDITNGEREVMIFIDSGKSIRFHEQAVRPMGRTARGVRGVKLQAGQKAVSLIIVHDAIDILTATENGFGKRTDVEEYRVTGRGGQGVISIQVNERNGKVIGAVAVKAGFDMMLITNRGTLVRTRADEVSKVGRNTQGVRLIRLSEGERLISLEAFEDVVADEAIDDISSEEE
ncbi:MAG: DNA gyrase subunit A [Gammaproteobacteria bacterium CG11_big_fil_rev_8_21_14_0_20_46_22]|nr:MAG: DNA gyrase subunit A [Gammaproteobacteria bacterium CG12_big_fil_rev_8_21_14_0_65_46_12]PIR11132.1 MAG: DNA gyrase subunit A [Gammaproteobacteria bacterium CG11_big_fil_rev_8_21_14_0_20_46_22]